MKLSSQGATAVSSRQRAAAAHWNAKPPARPRVLPHGVCAGSKRSELIRPQAVRRAPSATPQPAPTDAGAPAAGQPAASARPRVVVLGSGWASMSFIKALPADISSRYEVVVVSPRNYFLYTPLLPAVAVGTMEERSITQPVRSLVHGKAEYYEAQVLSVDPAARSLVACFPGDASGGPCFTLTYDLLVFGVGSVNNTFGIQGVSEYCQVFKSIEDASKLRRRISECFERAALPHTPEEERQRLLSFVVCGGGPTGVEVAAELHDTIHEDLAAHYPQLMGSVRIRLVEMADCVLSSYDRQIGAFTAKQFRRNGIELMLESRVTRVRAGAVTITTKAGELEVPFGACVWATGIAMNPLAAAVAALFPEQQTHNRCVLTDEHLAVKGSGGAIWAFGDAATIGQPHALAAAASLFDAAPKGADGRLGVPQLLALLHEAAADFPHLEEHAAHLEARVGRGPQRFVAAVSRLLHLDQLASAGAGGHQHHPPALEALAPDSRLSRSDFEELLAQIDSGLRVLPATAQVAKQQGEYLAALLASSSWDPAGRRLVLGRRQGPFAYHHKGSLAYVGDEQAVFDVPALGPIVGREAGMMWKGYESFAQISLRNQVLVLESFFRTKLFGRDFSTL